LRNQAGFFLPASFYFRTAFGVSSSIP